MNMQIATHWQPVPAYYKAPKAIRSFPKSRNDSILEYLDANGMTSGKDLCKALGITQAQMRYASDRLRGKLMCEQSGSGRERACMYWSASNPPKDSERCTTHRVHVFFTKHPWRCAVDIPDDICPVVRSRHTFACVLESRGRLISRVVNGTKQYKAVA